MTWLDACAVLAVGTFCAAALMILRARIAQLSPPVVASVPAELVAELATVRTEWARTKKELDGYLEALMDIEETVEHKRRRTASAASRIAREAEPEDMSDPAVLRARARGLGLPV